MTEKKPTDPLRELCALQLEQERIGIWTSTSREPSHSLSGRSLRARLWREVFVTRYQTALAVSTAWCRKRVIGQIADRYSASTHTVEKAITSIPPSSGKCDAPP
jgi:hypothetical protein